MPNYSTDLRNFQHRCNKEAFFCCYVVKKSEKREALCRIIGMPDFKQESTVIEFLRLCLANIEMRHEKEEILKEELRVLAIVTRDRLHLKQREMAKSLEMSESSYSDIETGRTMCGTLTAVLLLAMQEEPSAFLAHVSVRFEQKYEKEMQLL